MILLRALAVALIAMAGCVFAQQPAAQPKAAAGCADAQFRQFDFWIGDWDVSDPNGKAQGHNRVQSIVDGCALAEHWTSAGAGGVTGTSYSVWDRRTHAWRQFWVDSHGDVLHLAGGLVDGSMILQSDSSRAHVDRVTWTANADRSVRQFWESSDDGGTTWKPVFDGIYRKAR